MSSIKRSSGPLPITNAPIPVPEPPQPSHSEMAAKALPVLKSTFWNVYKAEGSHISNDALPRYGIQHAELSLSTGACRDGNHVFVKPLSEQALYSKLQQTQPWQLKSLPPLNSEYDQKHAHLEIARTLSRLFQVYLYLNIDETRPGVIKETEWRRRGLVHRLEKTLYSCTGGEHWEAGDILEQKDSKQNPHVACFLIDNAPMDHNRYSRPELVCVLSLMIDRVRFLSRHASVFPVTVFSISGRNFRVIHSYYSQIQQRLVVERSRVLNFDHPQMEDILLALSWILATPLSASQVQAQAKMKTKAQDPVSLPIHGALKKKKSSWFQ